MLLGIQLKLLGFLTTGLSPSLVQYSVALSNLPSLLLLSHYPIYLSKWFRLFPLRSPLLGESLLFSFPLVTKMFQFARFARANLCIQLAVFGLPHSDTSGSLLASSSPERFVGRYVLLRLYVPRDSPLALCSLTL